ncbi:MAG: hypothetical protein LBV09_03600 [Deferribacteraceae bacterium]|nr:hypothetical protein [Deferribacteraceae bacterium]
MEGKKINGNRKGFAAAGFCYIILVVAVLVLAPKYGISNCAGDCFTCHEELAKTPEHEQLGSCASCHDGSLKKFELLPSLNVNGGCGDRCFTCHEEWPKDGNHATLDTCLTCHDR